MNRLATQHESRRDGESRSYRGRVALVVTTMRGGSILPWQQFDVVAPECAGKHAGLERATWGSPG